MRNMLHKAAETIRWYDDGADLDSEPDPGDHYDVARALVAAHAERDPLRDRVARIIRGLRRQRDKLMVPAACWTDLTPAALSRACGLDERLDAARAENARLSAELADVKAQLAAATLCECGRTKSGACCSVCDNDE